MKDASPLVSVVAVCYNQSHFVVECLESIRQQTYKNIQLIIIDDRSEDDSAAVIQAWLAASGVAAKFVAHTENKGICRTFNEALSYAAGEYVSIIAADDVYLPDKIETQVALMEKLPLSVGVVYSDSWQMDADGNLLPRRFIETHREFECMPEGHIFPDLLLGNFIPAMTTLIRRQCYETVGLYDETLCYEDFDMWLRISQHYRFAFSPLISAKYRIVPTSMQRTVMVKKGWHVLKSNFRIYEKCISVKSISDEQRRLLASWLHDLGEQMYQRKFSGRHAYLLRLSGYALRPYTFGMLLFSTAGIPFTQFENFVSRYRSFLKRVRRLFVR